MKQKFISFIIVGFLVAGVFVYLTNAEDKTSYDSPEEALKKEESFPLEVTRIIETKFVEGNTVAYIFFYDEVIGNYLAAAQIVRNDHGWQYQDFIGIGQVAKGNIGNSTAKGAFAAGFITSDVVKAFLYEQEAMIINLEEKEMKLWFLHGVEFSDYSVRDFRFYDKSGNQVEW